MIFHERAKAFLCFMEYNDIIKQNHIENNTSHENYNIPNSTEFIYFF